MAVRLGRGTEGSAKNPPKGMRFARGFYVAAEAEAATHKAIERHTSAGSETSKEPALRKGLWVNPGGIHETGPALRKAGRREDQSCRRCRARPTAGPGLNFY